MDDLSDDELRGMEEYLESRLGQANSKDISKRPGPQKDKRVDAAVSLSADAIESLDLLSLMRMISQTLKISGGQSVHLIPRMWNTNWIGLSAVLDVNLTLNLSTFLGRLSCLAEKTFQSSRASF